LDAFTLNLLTNDEVLGIDQDPLGRPARFIADDHGVQVWVKPMEDGSWSVGLFNTDNYGKSPASFFRWGNERPKKYQLKFRQLGLSGKWVLRDVWRQADLGVFNHSFEAEIPHHGVVLLKVQRDPTQK
jgi:alpha-galactosidase